MKTQRLIVNLSSLILLAVLGLLPAGPARSQTANTGIITGVVKDQTGAVVAGATIIATNKATGVPRTTTSGDSGTYELTHLVPGEYRLEVDHEGFARLLQDSLTVNVLSRVSFDPTLTPSGSDEQVTVTVESASIIEVNDTSLGTVINQKSIEGFPVNGRSFAALAPLVPGATLQPSFDPVKARAGTFSVGGSTGRNVNVTVDGGDNKDNHVGGGLQNFTMEGIQEFALSTQRFSAANGRSSGALLSVITRSGTNHFHSSVFGVFRDERFNANASALLAAANPTLFEAEGLLKPPFSRQQFGGSLGGPIIRDKAFYFAAAEHTRERGGAIVPDFAYDQIRELAPFGYDAVRLLPQPYDETLITIKGDFYPTKNHAFAARYAQQNNRSLNDLAGFLSVFTDLSGGNKQTSDLYSLLGSWTWTINSRMVNQFLYQRATFNNQLVGASDLPNLSFPDGIEVGHNQHVPEHTQQSKHQFRDDLAWNRGSHGFKLGADFVYEPVLGGFDAAESAPIYRFNFTIDDIVHHPDQFPKGFFTSQVLPGPITGSPSSVAGMGVVAEISLAGGDPHFDLAGGAKQFSWYVQDDWKVGPRLTLNLGLRYDTDFGFLDSSHQRKNRAFNLFRIIGHPLGSRVVEDDRNNFSPRVGFAWDLKGNGRSVLRGGYGIYYDQSFLDVPLHAIQQANPEIYALTINAAPNLHLGSPPPVILRPLQNPPLGFGEIAAGHLIDPNLISPYTQQMSLGFARQLSKNLAVELTYVHVLGLHEFTETDANPRIGPLIGAGRMDAINQRLLDADFAAHAAEISAAFGQPVPFGSIFLIQSDGRSRYDALTVSVTKRYASGFQLQAHYTLSRTLAWFGPVGDFESHPQNPFDKFDPKQDFGHPGEDERHRFVLAAMLGLPWGLQLSPLIHLTSARPYSVLPDPGAGGGGDTNQDGTFNDRQTRDGNDQHHLPPGTLRGDAFAQVNLRVSKHFKFAEGKGLALFFEAFNLFNAANFGNSFDGTVGSPNFKRPINFFGATGFSEPVGIPFQGQFGFRLTF